MAGGSPISPSERRHFFALVGLPGAGKSALGAALARKVQLPFVDLDDEIVRDAELGIREIFALEGERGFRAREVAATRRIAAGHPAGAVVATGGGWMANEAAVALFRPLARIIYLRSTVRGVLRRMGPGVVDRPLLDGENPAASLAALLAERERAYLSADHLVDVEDVDFEEVVDSLVALAAPSGAT